MKVNGLNPSPGGSKVESVLFSLKFSPRGVSSQEPPALSKSPQHRRATLPHPRALRASALPVTVLLHSTESNSVLTSRIEKIGISDVPRWWPKEEIEVTESDWAERTASRESFQVSQVFCLQNGSAHFCYKTVKLTPSLVQVTAL